MATYVLRAGQMVNKKTGEPMLSDAERAAPVGVPLVTPAMPEYCSPIDGRVINNRQERKDDLARNGCIEWEPCMSPTKGKIKNKRFAAKHGMQVSEEFR